MTGVQTCALPISDASETAAPPFEFKELEPAREIAFTTHELSPASVLALTEELYARRPRAWMLAVRGYEWELAEGLSPRAEINLSAALAFLADWVDQGRSKTL